VEAARELQRDSRQTCVRSSSSCRQTVRRCRCRASRPVSPRPARSVFSRLPVAGGRAAKQQQAAACRQWRPAQNVEAAQPERQCVCAASGRSSWGSRQAAERGKPALRMLQQQQTAQHIRPLSLWLVYYHHEQSMSYSVSTATAQPEW